MGSRDKKEKREMKNGKERVGTIMEKGVICRFYHGQLFLYKMMCSHGYYKLQLRVFAGVQHPTDVCF